MKKIIVGALAVSLLVGVAFVSLGGGKSVKKVISQNNSMNQDFVLMTNFLSALKSRGVECTYVKDDKALFVRESGDCTYLKESFSVTLLQSTEVADAARKAFANLLSGYYIHSNNWTIATQDQATAQRLSLLLKIKIS